MRRDGSRALSPRGKAWEKTRADLTRLMGNGVIGEKDYLMSLSVVPARNTVTSSVFLEGSYRFSAAV